MKDRARRLDRILRVESKRVAAKERELAAAVLAVTKAEDHVVVAKAALDAALASPDVPQTSDDMAEADAVRRDLEARAAHARRVAEELERSRVTKNGETIEARVAERKLELVVEAQARFEQVRSKRLERRAEDEHASRRRTP